MTFKVLLLTSGILLVDIFHVHFYKPAKFYRNPRYMKDYMEIFDDSFQRVVAVKIKELDFFDRFYEIFLASSEQVQGKFVNTDMKMQKLLLRQSIAHMLNFSNSHQSTDHLITIAEKHSKSQVDIPPEMYDQWLDCIVMTVREFDFKFHPDVELAWRAVLAPGVAFMKFYYDK